MPKYHIAYWEGTPGHEKSSAHDYVVEAENAAAALRTPGTDVPDWPIVAESDDWAHANGPKDSDTYTQWWEADLIEDEE